MDMQTFRLLASLVTVVGVCLLAFVFIDWHDGVLAEEYFPELDHASTHHFKGLLLALPVPLHVIFIGLIIQKRWLSPGWARFAWVGITASGLWLGATLAVKWFFLPAS